MKKIVETGAAVFFAFLVWNAYEVLSGKESLDGAASQLAVIGAATLGVIIVRLIYLRVRGR